MNINHIKPSHEQAGLTREDFQVLQKRAFKVANSVYKVALAKYYGYPEAVEPRIITPPAINESHEVPPAAFNAEPNRVTAAQQAVLDALEKQF